MLSIDGVLKVDIRSIPIDSLYGVISALKWL